LIKTREALFVAEAARLKEDAASGEALKGAGVLLRLPLEEDALTAVRPRDGKAYMVTVVRFETVKTPAGTFRDCARLKVADRAAPAAATYLWFAAGVGLVKWQEGAGRLGALVQWKPPADRTTP